LTDEGEFCTDFVAFLLHTLWFFPHPSRLTPCHLPPGEGNDKPEFAAAGSGGLSHKNLKFSEKCRETPLLFYRRYGNIYNVYKYPFLADAHIFAGQLSVPAAMTADSYSITADCRMQVFRRSPGKSQSAFGTTGSEKTRKNLYFEGK